MSHEGRIISIRIPPRDTLAALFFVAVLLLATPALKLAARLSPPPPPGEAEPPAEAGPPNAQLADRALNERVERLLADLTLADKVGQLTQYTGGTLTGPDGGKRDLDAMVTQGQIGSLFNVVGARDVNRYQRLAIEKSPAHIPLLFSFDTIHGQRTIFPVPLGLAASFDPDLVQHVSRVAAQEAAADGIRWVFSPMVDISRDARWGRITEGAGEDTYLGSVLARAYVAGYQNGDLSKRDSVAACVKHFAAYGAPNAGREYNTVDMSELTLRQFYLPPYRAGVDAGAATVMSAFNPLNGIPATANPFTLTKILRREWKFDGAVVSDYGAVRELINHGVAGTGAVAARKALTAGVDMDMESDLYRTRLPSLIKNGKLDPAVLDEAVRRVLRVKFALGLFDHPYADETAPPYAATPEKRRLARDAAGETIVLLQNERQVPYANRVLPLPKSTRNIALIGPLADSAADMLGSWPGWSNPSDAVTLRTALQNRCQAGQGTLLYARGTDILTDSDAGFAEALAAARQADAIVLALGESALSMTGESSSLTRLDLPGNQEDLLEAVMRLGKPTVLVLFDGRPLAIKWAAAHVPAIVEAWYPGIEAGNAVADILFGDVNPSGKLPVTFPRAVGQEPLFYNQLPTGRPADDIDLTHPPVGGDKYYSRYIDETNAPLFPFGHGLSYTRFSYGPLRISPAQISAAMLAHPHPPTRHPDPAPSAVTVEVEVRNTGSVPGVETVQLYLRNIGGSVEEPVRELKGFQRVALAPGQARRIGFTLDFAKLSYFNLEMEQVVEPTQYQVWIGGNSRATQSAQFEVTP